MEHPGDILVDREGRIVITDFGFASYAQNSKENPDEFAASESLGGTLGFAAPEQISSAFGTVSFATAIYAIGGIAFYLLTGRGPHDTNSILDTVTDEDVHLSSSGRTQAESKLAAVAKQALRKAINCRPKSVDELITLLVD